MVYLSGRNVGPHCRVSVYAPSGASSSCQRPTPTSAEIAMIQQVYRLFRPCPLLTCKQKKNKLLEFRLLVIKRHVALSYASPPAITPLSPSPSRPNSFSLFSKMFFEVRANHALQSNPPDADLHITTHGSDWLWAVFSVMLLADLLVLFSSLRASNPSGRPTENNLFMG